MFHILEQHRESLDPCRPRPYHAELGLPIRLASGASIPTADENTEALDAGDADYSPVATRTVSTSFLTTVRETVQVELDDSSESVLVTNTTSITRLARTTVKDERIAAAESWLADYRACRPQVRAAPSALRAYRIWRANSDLNPGDVAALLRQPPLQTNTVVSYILEAIRLEKLPFESDRLQDEVLSLLPKEALAGRYRGIVSLVEQAERAKSMARGASNSEPSDSSRS